ncbi:MAG: riboflavin synthase [Clostridia bacterium]|nr:riboflavin synthase [Clostridia bacterium]
MFTGIIEEIGTVAAINNGGGRVGLKISCKKILEDIRVGDSIAVDGVCLTVISFGNGWFLAEVMPETIRRTGLSYLSTGSAVNLERALKLSDRLGGHIVSGHIDGTGTIVRIVEEGNALWVFIRAKDEIMKYIIKKGSVAVDGISLTVAAKDGDVFGVSLIPHTTEASALGTKKEGAAVNIECDMIGKYVEALLKIKEPIIPKEKLTLEFLKENGFY